MLADQRAGPPARRLRTAVAFQRAHHRHQIAVAYAFQLSDRVHPRLRVRLRRHGLDQLVGQVRHVHQPGPGPFQTGPELRDEMAHPRFAARDPVILEQAHLRPADAEAVADHVVDLFRCGDAVADQPQRLAPDRLKEPVANMCVDLGADVQRVHPDGGQHVLGVRHNVGRICGRGHKFGQRQQIDRVERMRDEDHSGRNRPLLQLARFETAGR